MSDSVLKFPLPRPNSRPAFYSWNKEDPELSRVIWGRLFQLGEVDLMSLYFCDYSNIWSLLHLEKPEWWTGNFADVRHELYRRPITRFVSDAFPERPFLKALDTQINKSCTSDEFDKKWRTGEFYSLYNQWA